MEFPCAITLTHIHATHKVNRNTWCALRFRKKKHATVIQSVIAVANNTKCILKQNTRSPSFPISGNQQAGNQRVSGNSYDVLIGQ